MIPRKKLIEVALPLEAINEASAREKSIRHGHPSTLHLWWARRPLAACRAVIFTSLVDDPDDPNAPPAFVEACRKLRKGPNASVEDTPRQRLFDFIETLVQWESTTNEVVLETARELIRLCTDGNPPPLFDPFAGGGSIPLEAQRLGLEAHASDLNPVAVMINKALIEIPPRFADMPPVNPRDRGGAYQGMSWKGAQGLAADVRYYGEWMRDQAWERIGHLYPPGPNGETVLAWIWARTVKSPNPAVNAHVPLIRNLQLSDRKNRRAWIEPRVDVDNQAISFMVKTGKGKAPRGTMTRQGGQCLISGVPIPWDYIRSEGQAGRMGLQMLAIITEGSNDRNYYPADVEQERIALEIEPLWKPDLPINHNPRDIRPQLYGLNTYADLFTARQLTVLSTFCALIGEVRDIIDQDASGVASRSEFGALESGEISYSAALSTYLAFAIDKGTDYWTTIATWMPRGTVGHAFARQAMPMTWDFPEANPFANFHCSWHEAVNWVARQVQDAPPHGLMGIAKQVDATESVNELSQPIISTDPPYYDNIAYADLSDFFYVWLRRSLRDVFPTLFGTLLVPKAAELVAASHRFGSDQDFANEHFEKGLQRTFINLNSIMNPQYPLTVYYAFKQTESGNDTDAQEAVVSSRGWETMLEGLISSGFTINGTWPMRSERSARSIAIGANALASSIVLVCRPRSDDAPQTSRREFVNALRRELPAALREMQSGSIAPVDLAQASIGPGMAIYSRYSRVLEADGSPLTVRTALQLINQELDAFLAESEGDVDADTRFCINWFEQFGFDEADFGRADVLARAKNTSVDGLVNAGVLEAGAGKVRLLHWEELEAGWDPASDRRVTVWEAVHHLIERLHTHGESGAAALLLRMHSDLAAEAKNLAYRLYQICDRKGWAERALDYNALVLSWPGVQQQASDLKQHQPPEQLGLF